MVSASIGSDYVYYTVGKLKMKLKKFDLINLIKNIDNLTQRGIMQGCGGIIIQVNEKDYRVMFMNGNNYGDGIFATIGESDVKYLSTLPMQFQNGLEEYLQSVDIYDETGTFIPCNVKEYDKVELIVEKPKYAVEGVHKGMTGCVISSYAINNQWLIIFSEDETGKDIADICVDREDFKVIE